jgi:GNAT superfamily N-acetyltransferase
VAHVRAVDGALLREWAAWLGPALKSCATSGQGKDARSMTIDELAAASASPDVLHSAAFDDGSSRGLVIVLHARWEERAIAKPMAKLPVFLADGYGAALPLARGALRASADAGVVLMWYRAANVPTFLHVALATAGFHVGSEQFVLQADLQVIADTVARIPMRGTFRLATPNDADAVADVARRSFHKARYTADPHFPAEWGARIYEDWGRQLVMGGADVVFVAEARGRVIGFVSASENPEKRPPGLLAVEPEFDGTGIGLMLARVHLDWFREHGVRQYRPRTEKNYAAINALYLSLGFQIVDADVTYHASPALTPLLEQLK